MYAAENTFDFKCADSTKKKVIETVANNFTKDEIEKISKNGKPVVNNDQTVTTDGKSAYSRSTSRNDGKTPVISFPRKPEESSVTHEVIHHLKAVDKDLSVRMHVCPHCGYEEDRDVNAARNILARALSILQGQRDRPAILSDT